MDFVNNGVNFPVWSYSESEKNIIKDRFGLKKNVKYFIAIGRLAPEKNIDFLVKAFNELNIPDIGLILLGGGPQQEYIKSIIKNDNIILAGYQTDVRSYIIASDYYISASDGEGLSMALLESMSVGLPMLVSNISCHSMVLSKFDDCVGYLFDKEDAEDMVEKLKAILEIDYPKASEKIKAVYKKMFTSKVMASNYMKEYENLVERK